MTAVRFLEPPGDVAVQMAGAHPGLLYPPGVDRVFSARLDSSAIAGVKRGARILGITQKRFLEEAIRAHVSKVAPVDDVWQGTCGIWKRDEPPAVTVAKAKKRMRNAYERQFKRRHLIWHVRGSRRVTVRFQATNGNAFATAFGIRVIRGTAPR